MTYSVQISFSKYQEIVDECKILHNILNSNEIFEIESLANLKDYLEEKIEAIESNTYIDSMKLSASRDKVYKLKESRFKGEKKLVDSFVITSVNKMLILTYQKKDSGGKFNLVWDSTVDFTSIRI
jgi:hypothetical protein